eukprot:2068056-Ditylum_brightwellii.AAC.1
MTVRPLALNTSLVCSTSSALSQMWMDFSGSGKYPKSGTCFTRMPRSWAFLSAGPSRATSLA